MLLNLVHKDVSITFNNDGNIFLYWVVQWISWFSYNDHIEEIFPSWFDQEKQLTFTITQTNRVINLFRPLLNICFKCDIQSNHLINQLIPSPAYNKTKRICYWAQKRWNYGLIRSYQRGSFLMEDSTDSQRSLH